MNDKIIGTKTVSEVTVEICHECMCEIDPTGLCDWECVFDGEIARFRRKGTVLIRTYRREDTLIYEGLTW